MDLLLILKHGHQVILNAIAELSTVHWNTESVCGTWSTKDIIAHLASIEHYQIELVSTQLGQKLHTPYLEQLDRLGLEGFNTKQVEVRKHKPYSEILDEYMYSFEQLILLMESFPYDLLHQQSLGSFYIKGYSLADYFVHGIYGHKREHAAQIVCFRDSL
jgi:hypothetical protein